MNVEAVIFDLDGVIVSTDELHYLAWKKMADKESIPFDRTINHRLRGVSRMESLNIILEQSTKSYTDEEKKQLASYKNDIYVELLSSLTHESILPGVIDVLKELKKRHIKLAIGSSSKNTRLILERIGLLNTFDAIADGTMITHSKPNPEVFLKAAQLIEVIPKHAIVVEDAHSGIVAAKQAGMIACAISDAKSSDYADYKLNHIDELITIIDRINTLSDKAI
jgi:beta-phosphoglucomutase